MPPSTVLSFSCSTKSPYDLCSFNIFPTTTTNTINCTTTTTGIEYCSSCPDGWTRDYFFSHYPNCLLPVGFYQGCFIVAIITSCFYTYPMFQLQQRLRREARRVVQLNILFSWIFTINMLCLWLENGSYEASIISFISSQGTIIFISYAFANMFFAPAYASTNMLDGSKNHWANSKYGKQLKLVVIVTIVGYVGLCIGALVTCRWENVGPYNVIMLCDLTYSALTTTLFTLICYQSADALYKIIDKASSSLTAGKGNAPVVPTTPTSVDNNNDNTIGNSAGTNNSIAAGNTTTGNVGDMKNKFHDLKERLSLFKLLNKILIATTVLPLLLVSLIWIGLSTFPFLGIVLFFMVMPAYPVAGILVYKSMDVKSSGRISKQGSKSNGNNILMNTGTLNSGGNNQIGSGESG
jgi:hypothetical protein